MQITKGTQTIFPCLGSLPCECLLRVLSFELFPRELGPSTVKRDFMSAPGG